MCRNSVFIHWIFWRCLDCARVSKTRWKYHDILQYMYCMCVCVAKEHLILWARNMHFLHLSLVVMMIHSISGSFLCIDTHETLCINHLWLNVGAVRADPHTFPHLYTRQHLVWILCSFINETADLCPVFLSVFCLENLRLKGACEPCQHCQTCCCGSNSNRDGAHLLLT